MEGPQALEDAPENLAKSDGAGIAPDEDFFSMASVDGCGGGVLRYVKG